MELQQAFLAEFAKAEKDGKVHAIGIHTQVVVPEFPAVVEPFVLAVLLDVDEDDLGKNHVMVVKLSNKSVEGNEPAEVYKHEFNWPLLLEGSRITVSQVILGFEGFSYSVPGRFFWDIHMDGRHLGSAPVKVLQKTKPEDK
ncbi:hypothetical protein BH11ARM2_BH11ARM2_39350 [soil metagenome]